MVSSNLHFALGLGWNPLGTVGPVAIRRAAGRPAPPRGQPLSCAAGADRRAAIDRVRRARWRVSPLEIARARAAAGRAPAAAPRVRLCAVGVCARRSSRRRRCCRWPCGCARRRHCAGRQRERLRRVRAAPARLAGLFLPWVFDDTREQVFEGGSQMSTYEDSRTTRRACRFLQLDRARRFRAAARPRRRARAARAVAVLGAALCLGAALGSRTRRSIRCCAR